MAAVVPGRGWCGRLRCGVVGGVAMAGAVPGRGGVAAYGAGVDGRVAMAGVVPGRGWCGRLRLVVGRVFGPFSMIRGVSGV